MGYSNPGTLRLFWAGIHTRAGLPRLTTSRAVPVATDQKAWDSSPSERARSNGHCPSRGEPVIVQSGTRRVTRCDAPYRNVVHRLASVPGNHGGMGEKKCSRCGKIKPLAEFSRAAHGRDGRAAHCKDCHNMLYRLPLDRVPTLTCFYCREKFPNPARRGPDRKFC